MSSRRAARVLGPGRAIPGPRVSDDGPRNIVFNIYLGVQRSQVRRYMETFDSH